MEIGILGAGCVGLFIGAHLQLDNDINVHFVGRSVLKRTEVSGTLTITDFKRPARRLRFDVDELSINYDPDVLKTCHVVFMCLKLGENNHFLKDIDKNKTTLVFLQNGVWKYSSRGHTVVQGMIPYGVNELAPGHFHRCTAGNLAFENTLPKKIITSLQNSGLGVNLYDPSEFEAVKYVNIFVLKNVFYSPYLHAAFTSDIRWFKLVINLGNALNAVVGRPLASCLRDRKYRLLLRLVWKEGLEVCKSANIRLVGDINGRSIQTVLRVLTLPNCAYNTIARIMRTTDENYKSSMLTDLILKRNTEIDELNRKIVEVGEKYGVSTPTNKLLVKLIKKAETLKSGTPSYGPNELFLQLERSQEKKSSVVYMTLYGIFFLFFIIYIFLNSY